MASFDIDPGKMKSKYAKLINMATHGTGQEKTNAQNMLKKLFINLPKI